MATPNIGVIVAISGALAAPTSVRDFKALVGRPVDIAPSAYLYRADRGSLDNPPESWIAVKHFANLPLNQLADPENPAVKQVLVSLLWEEIRPIDKLELTWPADATHLPKPEDLQIATLDNQGASSSWWNNLTATTHNLKPTVTDNGRTITYDLGKNTCGIVIATVSPITAAQFDIPQVRALVADTWKQMDVEIEWGFDQKTAGKDYSGNLETYDGRLAEVKPLATDTTTKTKDVSWLSPEGEAPRRGVKFTLLYMGTSKWRKEQPFISEREDVARTIVTVWTKSGNFSFLAADLENGPILAPEYGFFVRRTSKLPTQKRQQLGPTQTLLSAKFANIAGSPALQGWGTEATPWFGGNPSDKTVEILGITIPAKRLAMHPGPEDNVTVAWRSPIRGQIIVKASVAHAQQGSNGIEWWLALETKTNRKNLFQGATDGTGAQDKTLEPTAVQIGDVVSLSIGPKGAHQCDTTVFDFTITEVGERGRTWNVTKDVVGSIQSANPRPDSFGNKDVWRFQTEKPQADTPSEPPIALASQATNARDFQKELKARNLTTIREQVRARDEQTWEGAVTAMRGQNLPPHPTPPAGSMPVMRVEVPSDRLTAQWNLGAWHLMRHCATNPKNGRMWFNDFPYGILGAETYMVLRALDLMGSHKAAEDGLDQWISLPMDTDSTGQNEGALKDRPNGLFTDGHGCMTAAVGPDGWGSHMDGVHAFGPGSIAWTITEHYWMTGDKEWLKASAPRILANAEWILRQRQAMTNALPGGERLWSKGLQPALQVTPDSGGLWMQFYECEAYYWASIDRLAKTLAEVDPEAGAKLQKEADAYAKDLKAAVERSIALSPVMPIRDGTFHSVIPFACYSRGPATGAWGWERDGSREHVGPLYWETVQTAAPLVSPAGLLSPDDPRVQGYLDVLEDRFLLENPNSDKHDWFDRGWQYQGGLERTANMHLDADDVPVFLRSFLNCYAVDILPNDGYIFNEHAVHGPPDKIFEEAAFLERLRNLLLMEDGRKLWLARATPRIWLDQGKKIAVTNAPTHFGGVDFEILSDVDGNLITATIKLPDRNPSTEVWLRLRHPKATPIKSVTIDGKPWSDFDPKLEVVKLHGLTGTVKIEARY